MPKITILIPIYNVEKFLEQCLDSVVNQTLQDIEIVCINDGSKDNSLEILKTYQAKDSRIKIIDKPNSGYGASMNKGLEIATGEYIGVVEPDDFVDINMFEELYKLAQKFDADVAKSNHYEYSTKTNQSRKNGQISKFIANRIITAKENPKILKIIPSIWSAIYKNSFLQENNIRFLETPGASYQDTSFAFKALALAKKIVFTTNAYLHYRIDNENSSVASRDKVFAICEEYAELTRFLDEHPEIKEFANDIKLIKEYGGYLWNARRIKEEFVEDFAKNISKIFKEYSQKGDLSKVFYKRYSRNDIDLLINDTEKYIEKLKNFCEKVENKQNRRKYFSLRINSSRISLVVAGKNIIEIGF